MSVEHNVIFTGQTCTNLIINSSTTSMFLQLHVPIKDRDHLQICNDERSRIANAHIQDKFKPSKLGDE